MKTEKTESHAKDMWMQMDSRFTLAEQLDAMLAGGLYPTRQPQSHRWFVPVRVKISIQEVGRISGRPVPARPPSRARKGQAHA